MKSRRTNWRFSRQTWHRLLCVFTLFVYLTSSLGVLFAGGHASSSCRCGEPGAEGSCCCRQKLAGEGASSPQSGCCSGQKSLQTPESSPPCCEKKPSAEKSLSFAKTAAPPACCQPAIQPNKSSCCSTAGPACCGATSDEHSSTPGLFALCTCGEKHPSGMICNSDPRLLNAVIALGIEPHWQHPLGNLFSPYVSQLQPPESPPPEC